jgi:tRNA-2-methylthio-N6-dimethylallyladenosine synthase
MNIHEADLVREILQQSGYSESPDESSADVILLLTCSVRQHAEQRAIGRLQNLRGLKRNRPELVLGVLGCMAQNRAKDLADGLGADLVVGPDDYRRLPELIDRYRMQSKPQVAAQLSFECYEGILPRSAGPVTGMVTVMRGCSNYCAYCIVPYLRGAERSKSRGAVLAEVNHLAGRGVKDITLVGQNVLAYRDGDLDFAGLLQLAAEAAGGIRIRFITSHPKDVTRALASTLAGLGNFCRHIHLPVQSGSDRILAAMNRRYTRAEYLERISWLREAMPDISFTTDFLVAFPGETEDDFEQTMDIVRQVGFDFAYMFRHSERPGTRACEMEPKVPDEVARRRLARLVATQNRITRERSLAMVGQELEVLVERTRGPDVLARTRSNKIVVVRAALPLGTCLKVKLTAIKGWTPIGEPVISKQAVAQWPSDQVAKCSHSVTRPVDH